MKEIEAPLCLRKRSHEVLPGMVARSFITSTHCSLLNPGVSSADTTDTLGLSLTPHQLSKGSSTSASSGSLQWYLFLMKQGDHEESWVDNGIFPCRRCWDVWLEFSESLCFTGRVMDVIPSSSLSTPASVRQTLFSRLLLVKS